MTANFETVLLEYDELISKLRELRRKHINRGSHADAETTTEDVVDASVVVGPHTNLLILRLVREHVETCMVARGAPLPIGSVRT